MNSTVQASVAKIVSAIIVPVLEFIFALAVVYFIWGAAGLILSKEDSDKRNESKQHILYGVIGMFIMVAAYGIVRFIANTLQVTSPF